MHGKDLLEEIEVKHLVYDPDGTIFAKDIREGILDINYHKERKHYFNEAVFKSN